MTGSRAIEEIGEFMGNPEVERVLENNRVPRTPR